MINGDLEGIHTKGHGDRGEFFKGQPLDKNQIAEDLASKKKKSHIKCD